MVPQIFANNPSPTMSGHAYPRAIDNGAGEHLTVIRRDPAPPAAFAIRRYWSEMGMREPDRR
jgi:hypothetical protein